MFLIRRRPPVANDGGAARAEGGPVRTVRPVGAVRRLVRGVLVVAAGTAALSLAGPFALKPFADVAGAAGTVGVAFVLDFGGKPANVVSGCVTVPDTDDRYAALGAFVASKGLALPSYASSGLLCSINGVPTGAPQNCGQIVPGGYVYWSYFTGGQGGWSYSSTGALATVGSNDVEGWRFQNPGSGNPSDPAPRSSPVYRHLCPPVRPAPTTTTTASTAPSPRGGASTGGSAAQPHSTASAGLGGLSKLNKVAQSTNLIGSGSGSAAGPGTVAATGTSGSSAGSGSVPPISIPPDPEVGVVSAHHVTSGGGPDPLIVGGVLVAGLAVAAWARWRRRPRTP